MRPLTTYYCKCDGVTDSTFPIFQIYTASKTFNFKPKDYLIYEVVPEQNNEWRCMVSFQVLSDSPINNFWLLGDSFLRSTYSIYDVSNNRVGFVADFLKTRSGMISPVSRLMPMLMCFCCSCGICASVIFLRNFIRQRQAMTNREHLQNQ